MVNALAENVVILPPDRTLLDKLGGTKLDAIFPPQRIEKAQGVINNAADDLYIECVSESIRLHVMAAEIEQAGNSPLLGPKVKKTIAVAFSIKNKAAQGGYKLVATLAESLQNLCETIAPEKITPAIVKLIIWHAKSISGLLTAKVKADGGNTGKAILAEVQKIKV